MTRPYTWWARPLLWLRVWYDLTWVRLEAWAEERHSG